MALGVEGRVRLAPWGERLVAGRFGLAPGADWRVASSPFAASGAWVPVIPMATAVSFLFLRSGSRPRRAPSLGSGCGVPCSREPGLSSPASRVRAKPASVVRRLPGQALRGRFSRINGRSQGRVKDVAGRGAGRMRGRGLAIMDCPRGPSEASRRHAMQGQRSSPGDASSPAWIVALSFAPWSSPFSSPAPPRGHECLPIWIKPCAIRARCGRRLSAS